MHTSIDDFHADFVLALPVVLYQVPSEPYWPDKVKYLREMRLESMGTDEPQPADMPAEDSIRDADGDHQDNQIHEPNLRLDPLLDGQSDRVGDDGVVPISDPGILRHVLTIQFSRLREHFSVVTSLRLRLCGRTIPCGSKSSAWTALSYTSHEAL